MSKGDVVHKYLCLFLLVAVGGCSFAPKVDSSKPPDGPAAYDQRLLMAGKWFGDAATKDGGRMMHIVERFLDGTMRIRFRVVDAKGNTEDQTELSQWGISGNIYFTITRGLMDGEEFRAFDPRDPYFNDAYEVLELTEASFRYRHVSTNNEFVIKRVNEDFDFP